MMRIVKIGAIWCPGCLVMKKIWRKIEQEYSDLEILELDYDVDNEKVNRYNIGKILPVVIFFDDEGNELERLIGEQKEEMLREMIVKYRDNR